MARTEFSVRGQRVVVVGAARSGVAAAGLLARRGAHVTLTDVRGTIEHEGELRAQGISLELGGHRATTLGHADLVVVSPGVPLEQPVFDVLREKDIDVIGELELASRWLKGRIVAVTGTKGKSTTTTLIGRMLTAARHTVAIGGNIGVPLSSQVDGSTPETIHVVEASSFQLETTTEFRPWVAVWLNLSDDHLDRHASMEVYAQAKARIVANQTSTDWAVLNAEDPVVMRYGLRTEATPVTFSVSGAIAAGFVVEGAWIVRRTGTAVERLVALDAVELAGRHMLNNVLAATAVAHIVGASPAQMTAALAGFHGLEHVMEPVAAIGDVRFVNDSKATNVDAACRSIESFEGVVAIVGGHFKGGDLHSLGEVLREHGRAAVVIGDAVEALVEALSPSVTVSRAHSMREAVERAYDVARPGGVVLLAPACASFDWFRDYAERGRRFKEEVARLKSRVEEGTQV